MERQMTPHQTQFKQIAKQPIVWALALFLVFVCAFGGGSRHDIAELVWLRSAAALILAFALWGLTRDHWSTAWKPIAVVLALAVVMLVQLVPLPSSIWASLPNRELIAELDRLAGLGDVWRPITLSPSATWNSMASLIVPLTALIIFARLSDGARQYLPNVILAVCCVSAAIGIIQILSGGAEALYFYEVTNRGQAVGLFANRNHNGVLTALGLLIVLWRLSDPFAERTSLTSLAWISLALFLIGGVMVNASRAGLLAAVFGIALVILVRFSGRLRGKESGPRNRSQVLGLLLGALLVIGTIGLFVLMDRSEAAQRFLAQDAADGLRWEAAATTLKLATDNMLLGVGFGAFDPAYRIVEPRELLSPRYFNEAHNDLLQFVIEGGLLGIAVALFGAAAMIREAIRGVPQSRTESSDRILALLVMTVLASASLVDYPLRTPIMMVVASWAFFTLGRSYRPVGRP